MQEELLQGNQRNATLGAPCHDTKRQWYRLPNRKKPVRLDNSFAKK